MDLHSSNLCVLLKGQLCIFTVGFIQPLKTCILLFATTGLNLEDMLYKWNKPTDKYAMILLSCGI